MKKLSLIAAGLLLSAGLIAYASGSVGNTKQECTVASCEKSCDKSTCDESDCPVKCCPPCK